METQALEEQPELPEFTRVGPYRLLQQLGEGGMGVVHLALDPAGKAVAIKVLRPHVAADPASRTRLQREVETLSRIRHPNVAPIVDHDVTGDLPYVVTKYIAGPGLDEVIDSDGPLRGEALVRVGKGLAAALHAIHEAGVIHRDVKPGNILLLDGEPILIDFGIAHVADDVRLTRTGLVMGTPGYLSPEIVEGAEVTESTDWWGWAATLGFAAQGRPPFGRGTMESILSRVVRGEADLAGVDPALVPLLDAALSPEADDRPTDTEVLRALERYAHGGDVTDVLRVVPARAVPPTQVIGAAPTAVLPPVAPAAPPRTVAPAPPRVAPAVSAQPSAGYAAPIPAGPAAQSRPDGYGARHPAGYAAQPSAGYAAPTPARYAGPTPAGPAVQSRPDGYGAPPSAEYASPPRPAPAAWAPGGLPYRVPDEPEPTYARPVAAPAAAPGFGAPRQGVPGSDLEPTAPAGPPSPGGGPGEGYHGPNRPLPPRPAMAGDPRIGRATRGGVLAALAAVLIVGAAALPAAACLGALLFSVLARTADRSVTSLVLRRHNKGERSSDLALAILVSPIHVLSGTIATLAACLIPAAVGLAGVFASLLATRLANLPLTASREYAVSLAIGMALAVMMAWWGPGGAGLRRGSRSLARGIAPGPVAAQVIGAVLIASAGAIAAWAAFSSGAPLWWPGQDAPVIFSSLLTSP